MNRERKINRLQGYDYSSPGLYFITINVRNREPVFGEIIRKRMVLNTFGEIAKKCWDELPEHIGDCILDEYVVMPDHFHGIIFVPAVGYRHACTLQSLHIQRQYHKLPVIIGSYKSAVSKLIHRAGNAEFRWQKSYYDRIIRNHNELNGIRRYIMNNPVNAMDTMDMMGTPNT